ncbi:phosphate acyltransferase PlsX [Chamaesiphon sp.]|uniref:phosphate acyltransferase PlsX n=1 Tax=Chamaesiphon sp. TaxID=2814140 RepID=UPI003593F47E
MASTRARIALDAMGGDDAPAAIVAGAIAAQTELDNVDVLLVGDPDQIQACLNQHPNAPKLEIVPAEGTIEMHEEPLGALRRKPKASINVAMQLVKDGKADAVVSAGHSGAAMAAALLRLGRLRGIDRPAIAAVFPTNRADKSVVILDVGANVDCRPKYLEQFAVMGSVYSQYVLGVDTPRVGLLNIGEEESKGNAAAIEAHEILRQNQYINFVGNAEGRDVLSGNFDAIVCDGFVGNILLKFAEAVGNIVVQMLREELPRGLNGKVGTALLKPNLQRLKKRIDAAEHGGGLLLGVEGVCIISHGSSDAFAIANAIRSAKSAVDKNIIDRIQSLTRDKKPTAEPVIASD